MRDEIDGRIWTDHSEAFCEDLGRLFASLGHGFKRLNAIQFDAPWKRGTRGPGHA
jgi:hypothetical protein